MSEEQRHAVAKLLSLTERHSLPLFPLPFLS